LIVECEDGLSAVRLPLALLDAVPQMTFASSDGAAVSRGLAPPLLERDELIRTQIGTASCARGSLRAWRPVAHRVYTIS
jgi:hypothetical protein